MRRALGPAQFLDRLADRPPQTDAARITAFDHRLLLARGLAHGSITVVADHEPCRPNDIWIGIYEDLFFCHVR